jgi:hypothetical protein
MPRTLFNITEDLLALDDILFESGGDATDERSAAAMDNWFDEIEGDFANKVEAYCCLIREIEHRCWSRKQEEERMRSIRKIDENTVKSLKDRMRHALDSLERTRVDTGMFRVTVAKNGGKQPLVIDEGSVPHEFTVTKVTSEPDKDLIRETLDKGGNLPFARLNERGRSLRIN